MHLLLHGSEERRQENGVYSHGLHVREGLLCQTCRGIRDQPGDMLLCSSHRLHLQQDDGLPLPLLSLPRHDSLRFLPSSRLLLNLELPVFHHGVLPHVPLFLEVTHPLHLYLFHGFHEGLLEGFVHQDVQNRLHLIIEDEELAFLDLRRRIHAHSLRLEVLRRRLWKELVRLRLHCLYANRLLLGRQMFRKVGLHALLLRERQGEDGLLLWPAFSPRSWRARLDHILKSILDRILRVDAVGIPSVYPPVPGDTGLFQVAVQPGINFARFAKFFPRARYDLRLRAE
mmetsp:Transcript_35083/g.76610  ORF Transcript_35083/g.76610 Transcript_35083/m.76610 type:complete len:285 (+) Transcript_35083:589-1443(+)